jgi:hypothetical protein
VTIRDLDGGVSQQTFVHSVDVVAANLNFTDLVTSDSTPALTGIIDDTAARIDVTIAGVSYPAINNGDGTWQLPDNLVSPPLGSGRSIVRVVATDIAGNEKLVTGSVTVVIHSPTDIQLAQLPISESASTSAADLLFGTLSAADADVDDQHAYQLIAGTGDTDNARFVVRGNELMLKQGQTLDFETRPVYSVRVRVSDALGNAYEEALSLTVVNETEVSQVQLNNGTDPSRSQISSLTVVFDQEVDQANLAGAFVLTNIDTGVRVTSLIVGTPQIVDGRTVVSLTFGIGDSVVSRQGSGLTANSLADGNYRLDVVSSQVVSSSTKRAMVSDYLFGGQKFGEANNDNFFRLLGDANGDGVRNGIDLNAIIPSLFNPANYRPDLDTNGDGAINGIDLNGLISTLFGQKRK